MRICLIGSNGFLSNSIGIFSNNNDMELTVVGKTKPDKYNYQQFISSSLDSKDFPFKECLNNDIIIYAAAAGVHAGSYVDEEILFYVNTHFPITLIERLKTSFFKGAIITFGSYFEIGNNVEEKSFTEEELIYSKLPVPNNYCLSKRLLTRYISSLVGASKNFHFILPTIYGETEKKHRLLPYLINSILAGNQISLTSGEQIRQYLYIDDLIQLLFNFINKIGLNGIYNCPCAETLSVKEITEKVFKYFSLSPAQNIFGKEIRSDVQMKILQMKADEIPFDSFRKIEDIIPKYLHEYQKSQQEACR